MTNQVRAVGDANGGIVKTAKLLGVSKSLVGEWCTKGTVYALSDALELAELWAKTVGRTGPPGSIQDRRRLVGFLHSISGRQ